MEANLTLKKVLLRWLRLSLLIAIISGISWLVINMAIKPILGGV